MANETKKDQVQEQTQETQTQQAPNVVQLPVEEKKGSFLRDMSIGMKIGCGLVFGGLAFGAGFLIKKVFFSGADNDAPIEAEGTVSEPTEG